MKDEMRKPARRPPRLFDRAAGILEEVRTSVVHTVNTHMVVAYWLIGREIVQDEQGGRKRAAYGDALLEDLSRRLTKRYGKGYSVTNLKNFRTFHQVYADRLPPLRPSTRAGSGRGAAIRQTTSDEWARDMHRGFAPQLSWSHYSLLMRVENRHARSFYEIQAIRERWTVADLERQITTLLFERLIKSRSRKGVLALARKGSQPQRPVDLLKDPFVLEFLDLPEGHELVESRFEQALVDVYGTAPQTRGRKPR